MKAKFTFFVTTFSFVFQFAFGQIDFTPYPGNTTYCSGVLETFTSTVGTTGCGTRTWTITNGKFRDPQTLAYVSSITGNAVDVRWDNVAATGVLTVTVQCGTESYTQSKNYAIRSLTGRTLANPRANQTLPYCSTATIGLAVDVMFLLNTGGTSGITQQRADGYEWILPTGWSLGGSTGTITSTTEFITIQADNACRGGSVSVRAYVDGGCTSGKSFSSSSSISINRSSPSISVTPQAGYGGPSCGLRNPVTFTANHNLTCVAASNGYLWSFPSGWLASPIYTNSNSITVTPGGGATDGGPINVTVNLSCGSQLPATPLQLVFALPVISVASPVCNSGVNVTLTNVAPTISVTWNGGVNMTVYSGQGTSSAVIKANSTGSLGNGTISASVNCPNTTVAPKTVWVGTPGQPGSISGNTTPSVGGIYQYICSSPSQGAAYHNWLMPYGGDPLWSQSGGNVNGIIDTLTPNFIVGSSSGFLQVFGVNACPGNSGVRKLSVIPTGGGGGGIQRIMAYPNPAQKDLTVEDVSSSTNAPTIALAENTTQDFLATLVNDQNQEVKSGKSKKGKISFDLQDLRNGFYYLHIKRGDELTTKQIQIKK